MTDRPSSKLGFLASLVVVWPCVACGPSAGGVVDSTGTGGNTAGDGDTDDDGTTSNRPEPSGEMLWERRIDGGANLTDAGQAITLLPDGTIVVGGGLTRDPAEAMDACLIALDGATGDESWQWCAAGSGASNDLVLGVETLANGELLAVGNVTQPDAQDGRNAMFARVDASGKLVWLESYRSGNGFDTANDAIERDDGSLCAVGRETVLTDGVETTVGFVHCMAGSGSSIGHVDYGGDGPTSLIDIAANGDGSLVVVGNHSDDTGRVARWSFVDADLSGAVELTAQPGTGLSTINGIETMGEGLFAVAGTTPRGTNPDAIYVGTLATDDAPKNGVAIDGRAPEEGDVGYDVVVDPLGDLVVAGVQSEADGDRAVVFKLEAGQQPYWTQYRTAPGGALAAGVAVDARGYVYVVGTVSDGETNERDLWVAKFAP